MAFRFRKRIKILPGVHMNIGKRGVSYSIGPRGAQFTFGNGRPGYTDEPKGYWGRPWGPKFLANAVVYAAIYAIAWLIVSGILMALFLVVDESLGLNVTKDDAFTGSIVFAIILLMCAAYAIYLYIRRFKRKLNEARAVIH